MLACCEGSPFRDPISMAILKLQENGRIQVLYNKWWKNTGICVSDDKKKDNKASSLGVANVGGIFVVLFVGLALAVVVAILEFVWNSRKNTTGNRLTKQVSCADESLLCDKGRVRSIINSSLYFIAIATHIYNSCFCCFSYQSQA